jgi:SAM-dependent methyltransferase
MTGEWSAAEAYEAFMGHWSRRIAHAFLSWLSLPHGASWLDVGCGTGALTAVICSDAEPVRVVGCDRSPAFVAHAQRQAMPGAPVAFEVAGLDALPDREGGFDAVVAGLVLNFLPSPVDALRAMAARARRGQGTVAVYVWDYAEGMQPLRHFWDAAIEESPAAATLDEGRRFPLCAPDALGEALRDAGLSQVRTTSLESRATFPDFDAFWDSFLGGVGPAGAYVAGLPDERRSALRRILARRIDGGEQPLTLRARAFAASGRAT